MPSIQILCPAHEDNFELECDVDPGDSNYGADADGNRGMYIGPSLETPICPDTCPECNHTFSEEERKQLDKAIEQAVSDWHWEPPDPADFYDPNDD